MVYLINQNGNISRQPGGFFCGKIDFMGNRAESMSYKTYRDPTAVEVVRRTQQTSCKKTRYNEQQVHKTKPVTLLDLNNNYQGPDLQSTDIDGLNQLAAELRLLKLKGVIDKDQYTEGIRKIYWGKKIIKARNKQA